MKLPKFVKNFVKNFKLQRFLHLGPKCASETGANLEPYGVDPVFLRTSPLFDEELVPSASGPGNASAFTHDSSPVGPGGGILLATPSSTF